MKTLVTGSSGHLGEALVRTLRDTGWSVVGLDVQPSPFTDIVGSIADAAVVAKAMQGVDGVLHTATLHKPHVVTHSRREFVDTNIVGTLTLLEAAVDAGVKAFINTSTTSVFGRALTPAAGEPTAWITEAVHPIPKNIYGVTKKAAEDLCELFNTKFGLPCLILRTSRFFTNEDDDANLRRRYVDQNVKTNEYLYRRVDLADVVTAHLRALERAQAIGFRRYIVSATTPFSPGQTARLRDDAPGVLRELFPAYETEYERRGWKMFRGIDRVYVNSLAREELGWDPHWTFARVLDRLAANEDPQSPLARTVGIKGYHPGRPAEELYPTE
jgi:UDP-glucose 4-epimerase